LIKFLTILHLLSFDVVLGAVVCNIMFWKLNKIPPEHSFAVVVILGLSVWIIYVLDRLLDNRKSDFNLSERHLFHRENTKILWYFIVLLVIICSILVFYLPFNIIIFGIVISLLTGIYLLIISKISSNNNFQHYKEPITTFVYVSAVFGTTILHNPQFSSLLIGFIFLLIVFQNLLLFSLSEFKKNTNFYNLAEHFGIKKSNLIIVVITCIITILGVYLINYSSSNYENKVVFMEINMSFILLTIHLFDNFFLTNDRYRWVGDGIFLLPLLIIF
jgi:predicted nucleic acid binding AN1-type Zn finger protein